MTPRDLLQMALGALESYDKYPDDFWINQTAAMEAIRAHLAKPDETAELLREMAPLLDIANEIIKGEYPVEQWLDYGVDYNEAALAKYREMTK